MRVAVFTSLLVGCTALSGLDDLSTEDANAVPSMTPPADASSGASDAAARFEEAAVLVPVEAATDADAALDAAPPTRSATFEDGSLVHPASGFDALFGSPKLATTPAALVGAYAVSVDNDHEGGSFTFAAIADLEVTFRVRVAMTSTPGSVTLARVRLADGKKIDLVVGNGSSSRALRVVSGSTVYGTGGALPNDDRVHRVLLHIAPSLVELRIADENFPFGPPAILSSPANLAPSISFDVGSVDDGDLRAVFDDVVVRAN